MTQRYSGYNGSGTGSSGGNNYDDITLKLQKYSAVNVTGMRVNAFDSQYGDKFIVGFEDVEVLDGIVFQRDDKADTWKVFSPGKFFAVNPDDGKVYETASEQDDGSVAYENEMSAQDILEHPRVLGFSETFGGNDYFYTPVGAVVEATESIATNDDVDVETTDQPTITVGEVSMLLSNKSWVRTLAKLLTAEGNELIEDDGTTRDEGNPKYESHGWLTTMDPTLRDGIKGRKMELFIIEETQTFDGEETTYSTPILLDAKTGNRITIDNLEGDAPSRAAADDGDSEDDTDAEAEPAVADGGTTTADTTDEAATATPETTETADSPSTDASAEFPDELEELIDYFARTDGEASAEDLREFAESEVDDPDAIDWDAASAAVEERA